MRIARITAQVVLKGLWTSTMVLTPLFGVWLSSSLAAYSNRSMWLCLVAGCLLFPILPVAWDQFSSWRKRRRHPERKRVLTTLDRLVLRTLALNLTFILLVLWAAPTAAFRALSTRGDWMLDGRDGPTANRVRGSLFALADGLGRLHSGSDNPYGSGDAAPEFHDSDAAPAVVTAQWPLPAKIHPAVTSIPPGVESDYRSVASYLAGRESDPFLLVKALHDYVVVRLEYDFEMLEAIERGAGDRASQEPDDVFRSRKAVCAGFAKLLSAMGEAAGIEIAYVTGQGGRDGWEVDGSNHAWNAAKIDEHWYLIDATWDDDTKGEYETTYLFAPPDLFGLDHFPKSVDWQLRRTPITAAEFMRQPMISAQFKLLDLEMRQPRRSQITVSGRADMVIENPRGVHLFATAERREGGDKAECEVRRETLTRISCELPRPGTYVVHIFGSKERTESYDFIARLFVNNQ